MRRYWTGCVGLQSGTEIWKDFGLLVSYFEMVWFSFVIVMAQTRYNEINCKPITELKYARNPIPRNS